MSTDVRPRPLRIAVAAVALAAALLPASALPAAAAPPSPAEEIANALDESPVHVDDAYATALDAGQQRELAAQIDETGLPIKVALVPLVKGDDFDGDAGTFAEVLHSRLDGDLILITTSEQSDWLQGYEWPDGKHQANDAVGAVGHLDEMNDVGLAGRVAKAVELIDEGNGTQVYEEATADLGDGPAEDAEGSDDSESDSESGSGSGSGAGFPWLAAAVTVVVGAVLVGALLYVRRARGGRPGTAPFASPQAVFAAAREADEAELRRRAEAEVVALGEAVQAADSAADADHLHTALDAYTAAGTVLDAAAGRADLAGVLALVAEGRDALQAAATPRPARAAALPLCFFNPLHGRAARRIRWRLLGRRNHLQVAACDACTTAVRARRAPEVLTDDLDGRSVPYFELPPERSLWAATGYGSLIKDTLAARVARGDFTRTKA